MTTTCTECHHEQQKELLSINNTCLDKYECARKFAVYVDLYYDKYLNNSTLESITNIIAKDNPDLKMLPPNYFDFVASIK